MKNLRKIVAGCSALTMCFSMIAGGFGASAESVAISSKGTSNVSVNVSGGSKSSIVVNGVEYSGNSVSVNGNSVVVDGTESQVTEAQVTESVAESEVTESEVTDVATEVQGIVDNVEDDTLRAELTATLADVNNTEAEEVSVETEPYAEANEGDFEDSLTVLANGRATTTYKNYSASTIGATCNYRVGDINGDGSINSKDLTALSNYLGNKTSTANTLAMDINKDGKINEADYSYLSLKIKYNKTIGSKTICLDAGHATNENKSTIANSTYYEGNMSWKLHKYLAEELMSYGFTVKVTRSSQSSSVTPKARGLAAKGCDLFVAIHSNAVSTSTTNNTYTGSMAIVDYTRSSDASLAKTSQEVGTKLVKAVASTTGLTGKIQSPPYSTNTLLSSGTGWAVYSCQNKKDYTYSNYEYYGVLRGSRSVGVPGVLLEHSYHTSSAGTNFLSSDANLKKLAKAEAKAIAEQFGWYY